MAVEEFDPEENHLIMKKLPALCALLLLLTAAGCNRGPERVPVSGQVLIDGKPLTMGHVQVQPAGARASLGDIDATGRFTLYAKKPSDPGVVLGEHDVAIHAIEVINAGSQRRLVPPLYETPSESKLKVNITGPTDNLTINLTWEGSGKKGPYIENFGKE